jgi:hypothetical protein
MEHRFPKMRRGKMPPESLANKFILCFVVVLIISLCDSIIHLVEIRA